MILRARATRRFNQAAHGAQRESVSRRAESHDAGDSDIGNRRAMTHWFAPVHVRQMHFDGGSFQREDRVANRHASMRITSRVDEQRIDFAARLLNPRDDLALAIGLESFNFYSEFGAELLE